MAKISINLSLNPEANEAEKNQDLYQNFSYNLSGLKTTTKLEELNDFIYEWIKKQKK